MEKKNNAHVCIRNKEFVISGYESAEYMQKIAAYLNNKIEEVRAVDDFRNLDREMKNIMLEINITDELFKIRGKAKGLEAEAAKREEELYNLKHEFIAMKTKMGEMQNQLDEVGQAYEAARRKLDKLASGQENRKSGTEKK